MYHKRLGVGTATYDSDHVLKYYMWAVYGNITKQRTDK